MQLLPLQVLPLPVAAVFGVMGLLLFVLGVRSLVFALRQRLGRPTPVGELDANSGRVTVSGVARRADAALDAPLSGEPCLAYSWRETELRTQRGLDGGIDTGARAARPEAKPSRSSSKPSRSSSKTTPAGCSSKQTT